MHTNEQTDLVRRLEHLEAKMLSQARSKARWRALSAGIAGALVAGAILWTRPVLSQSEDCAVPHCFVAGEVAVAADVNENFAYLAERRGKLVASWLMTGAWLDEHAAKPADSRTYALDGLHLSIGTAGTHTSYQKLLEVPLLPAGVLSSNESYRVQMRVIAPPVSVDNDLYFGLSDGSRVFAFARGDGESDILGASIQFTDASADTVELDGDFHNIVPAAGADRRWVDISFRLTNSETELVVFGPGDNGGNGETGVERFTDTLDLGQALALVVVGNEWDEPYEVHLLDVTVIEEGY